MKKYIFYLIAFLAVSCEDVLDKKNLGAIDDSYVWSDPNMIELNVNSFYANWMPTGLFERPGLAELGIISDEARSGYNGRAVNWINGVLVPIVRMYRIKNGIMVVYARLMSFCRILKNDIFYQLMLLRLKRNDVTVL